MAQQVNIFDGEVNRNWNLTDSTGEKHLLSLFHDCVTGARAAMLDYEEVPGSAGTTNVFNLVSGRVELPFSLKKGSEAAQDSGRLSIVRRGLTGFSYECELNGRLVLDTTSTVQNTEYEYEVSMPATVDTGSRVSGVTWYEVHTMRKADSKGTLVHRRFRDFSALQEQVESLMKGHHLRSSLPRFPGKKSKLWTNHGDLSFVEDRRRALEQYLKTLLQLPHVSTLDSTRAFLGMVGNLREFSVPWEGKELGVKLKRASEVADGRLGVGGEGASSTRGGGVEPPPVIVSVQGKGKSPPGVCPGDRLFKVDGESTESMSLEAVWSSAARATRPVMLHFLGPILRMDSTLTPLPEAFLRRRTTPGMRPYAGSGGSVGSRSPAGAAAPGGIQQRLGGMSLAWKPAPQKPLGSGVSQVDAAGGAVGPFGDGAGASGNGWRMPSSSRLGRAGTVGVGVSKGEHDANRSKSSLHWQSPAGAGSGSGAVPYPAAGRPSGGKQFGGVVGVGGSNGNSGWMPSVSPGSTYSASSATQGKGFAPRPAGARLAGGFDGASAGVLAGRMEAENIGGGIGEEDEEEGDDENPFA